MSSKIVFLAKGHAFLGQTSRDAEGNVVKHVEPHFEVADDGGCIAVGLIDSDSMEVVQDPTPEVYGDYDPAHYLAEALRLLSPKRRGNIPDFKEITKRFMAEYHMRNCPFLDYCPGINCRDCIVSEWMEEENV